ncbi:hypothetical protein EW146_g49 [Bondarzewia mesenterica]|uniref:FAS1 domain-containing protein n=1 Tax=Bondarzewia mesenterica TaxID=1095465 RepID=A0A4S4M897_9AGAM|nr:hypothetical protein EW146_g49 [Bondarzewia mesenterica]
MKLFSLTLLLVLPLLAHSSSDDQFVLPPTVSHSEDIIMPLPVDTTPNIIHAQPTLSDLLTIERSASIFFSYARELELSRLFSDASASDTVLVPTNAAVMALTRKPHQGPTDVEDSIEISEQEFDARSKKNVERWVSSHIIPVSPITFPGTYPTLLDGKTVTFTQLKDGDDGQDASAPEWTRVVLNGHVRIVQMKEASNGMFYLIDGTVNDD